MAVAKYVAGAAGGGTPLAAPLAAISVPCIILENADARSAAICANVIAVITA